MADMAISLPRPAVVLDLARSAVGTATTLATVPGRALGLLENVETLVSRISGVVDRIEATLERTDRVVDAAETAVTEVEQVTGRAAGTLATAERATTTATNLLDGYAPALTRAAPMVDRFVAQLSPEEVTAAIRLIDELPRLREHLTSDVLPILATLDRVGPDLHDLLDVTRDLRLAVAGIPGLARLRRRGENRLADTEES